MCTAITFSKNGHYFARNLDWVCSLHERVVITPRRFPFRFRHVATENYHNALIGMAIIADEYPLYFDATNEHGLSAAGLNFPNSAVYHDHRDGFYNIAPFEFIPWVLSRCTTVADVRILLARTNLINENFSSEYPNSPLHWIIADKETSITVEPVSDGLKVYDNPIGTLTNEPPFDYHIHNLNNYLNITSNEAINRFSNELNLKPYSLGMGAIGLPGDFSSASRFVRATFAKYNCHCGDTESESISQIFHILGSVSQPNGCTKVGTQYEKTIYSSCCNMEKCIYYYTTYENSQIQAVSLFSEDLDMSKLKDFPLIREQQIQWRNR